MRYRSEGEPLWQRLLAVLAVLVAFAWLGMALVDAAAEQARIAAERGR